MIGFGARHSAEVAAINGLFGEKIFRCSKLCVRRMSKGPDFQAWHMGRGKGCTRIAATWTRIQRETGSYSPRDRAGQLFRHCSLGKRRPHEIGFRISFIFGNTDRLVTRVRIQGWLNVILWNMVSCFDRRIGFGTRYCYGSLHILNVKMEGSAFENVWKEKRRIK